MESNPWCFAKATWAFKQAITHTNYWAGPLKESTDIPIGLVSVAHFAMLTAIHIFWDEEQGGRKFSCWGKAAYWMPIAKSAPQCSLDEPHRDGCVAREDIGRVCRLSRINSIHNQVQTLFQSLERTFTTAFRDLQQTCQQHLISQEAVLQIARICFFKPWQVWRPN